MTQSKKNDNFFTFFALLHLSGAVGVDSAGSSVGVKWFFLEEK